MSRMLGKSHALHTCVYGCCGEHGTPANNKTAARRLARRRERQAIQRNLRDE
jgi:hypothetical protein